MTHSNMISATLTSANGTIFRLKLKQRIAPLEWSNPSLFKVFDQCKIHIRSMLCIFDTLILRIVNWLSVL